MAKFDLREGKKNILPQSYPSILFHPQNFKRMLHVQHALQSKKRKPLHYEPPLKQTQRK